MATPFAVGKDGVKHRGWPEVRIVVTPTDTGAHWRVHQVTYRGRERFLVAMDGGFVPVDAEHGVRDAFEAAWYNAMMACPEMA